MQKNRFMAPLLTAMVLSAAAPAFAAPFVCSEDSFVIRRGGTLTNVNMKTGAITNGPNLSGPYAANNINAIAQHPVTGEVFAFDVNATKSSLDAVRIINTNGLVESPTPAVSMTPRGPEYFAGATFDSTGLWLLANGDGLTAVVDLVAGSLTYGTTIQTGSMAKPEGAFMSGDMAFRASDQRIYFYGWGAAGAQRIYSVSLTQFTAGGEMTPLAGPLISGLATDEGAMLAFDREGNLFGSSTTTGTPSSRPVWKIAAADLTAPGPITPVVIPGVVQVGSGSDGFSCYAPQAAANPVPVPGLDGRALAALMLLVLLASAAMFRQKRGG